MATFKFITGEKNKQVSFSSYKFWKMTSTILKLYNEIKKLNQICFLISYIGNTVEDRNLSLNSISIK